MVFSVKEWQMRRAEQPWKSSIIPLLAAFAPRVTDDMVHLDDLNAPVDSRVVWSEGNPIPHWFMLSRGGLHVSHFSAEAPWAGTRPDPSVIERVPRVPQKWGRIDCRLHWPGRSGFVLGLGDMPGCDLNRWHPKDAAPSYSLESLFHAASEIRIDNPHSGLILSAVMTGKPVTAPMGGLFGPLAADPSWANVVKCLTWLEDFSVNVTDPYFADDVEARLAA